jgi:hypothetical protein
MIVKQKKQAPEKLQFSSLSESEFTSPSSSGQTGALQRPLDVIADSRKNTIDTLPE